MATSQPEALHVLSSSAARDNVAEPIDDASKTLQPDDEREKRSPVFGNDGDSENAPHHSNGELVLIPNKYRWVAFGMIIFFATGSSFAEAVLGPLKSTLLRQLRINNAQYGAIASAENLINTILPIIGGIGMDYWGATYAAILSSVFILIGSIVAGLSAQTGHYQLLIAGRVILGLGSTIIESTQNKLLAHWFSGSTLGFVFALDIAWNRVIGIIARSTAVPMSSISGFWGWALWIPAITCAVNLGLCIMYWAFERSVPKQYQPKLGRDARHAEGWDRKRIIISSLTRLPKFFWILCGTQLFQNAAVSVYTSNLADMQTKTRGTSTLAAGYNSSLQGVIPIILTPVAGLFFDKIGWRMAFVSWTAALYIIVFVLIGFTQVHPLAPILISSFALVTNALAFIGSIPVLVGNDALLGTAFGVWRCFQNCNTTILEVAAGAIQDRTPGETYERVFYLLIAIKSIEVLWGPFYDFLDGRWLNHSLRRPELTRLRIRKEASETPDDLPGWRVSKLVRGIVGGQLCAMIITSWVVYIVFSLGT